MLRANLWLGLLLGCLTTAAAATEVAIEARSTTGPVRFGVRDLRAALAAAGYTVGTGGHRIVVGLSGDTALPPGLKVPDKPESFAILRQPRERRIIVAGSDATGAMYGLLELAEKVTGGTKLEDVQPQTASPFIEFRAPNPFWSLPDPVLDDWEHWWFRSESFWRTYLDLLARSRMNWVDLHGMLHIRGAWSFPAIFPYFVESKTFPGVGLPPAEKARNLAALRRAVALAADRGIRIALMSYTTSWNVPGAPQTTYPETEDNLALYTRECVAELLRQCPDLGMIGFRIGESGKSEGFFKRSYMPGILDSGLPIPVYSRTWLSSKPPILELEKALPGRLTVEIKYNGEHYGLPYHVAGGRMAGWQSYSYQDYCQPPQPYGIIWQNRASGTHRLWRWANPEWVARTVRTYPLAGARGFSLEPLNAYRPNYDYYHQREDLKWFRWVHERDWLWYAMWGRLSYDPSLGEGVWLQALAQRFGPAAARAMLTTSREMSMVIPLIYSAHCQGPDHLNMAPELETGGSLADFAGVPPLDTLAMQSTAEYTQRLVSGNLSARTAPLQMADMIETAAGEATAAVAQARQAATRGLPELADWEADVTCLRHLGTYYAEKIRAATYLELYRQTADPAHLAPVREHAARAVAAWRALAEVTSDYYRPIVESMRPRTETFRWADLTPSVEADLAVPEKVRQEVEATGAEPVSGVQARHLKPLTLAVTSQWGSPGREGRLLRVRVSVEAGGADLSQARAFLYHKPLASEFAWRKTRLARAGSVFDGTLLVSPVGAQWAVEVVTPDAGACWPDWRVETPYRTIEAWGPAPSARAAALADLRRADLSRRRYSAILCGRVASRLNAASAEQKRALLDHVAAGQTLVIFNQDYPGGFDPSWLPGGVQGSDADFDVCEARGPHPILAGIPAKVALPKIVNDALSAGDEGWLRLTEPWGLAVRAHGQGEIILVQLRLEELYEYRVVAQLLRNVVQYARRGSALPLLFLDEGSQQVPTAMSALGMDDWVGAEEVR